jgi:hypothetical protein
MKPIAWVATLLAGCAAPTIITPEYYRAIPTAEICQQIWSVPAYNVNNPARYAELERRQTSCGDPPAPPK